MKKMYFNWVNENGWLISLKTNFFLIARHIFTALCSSLSRKFSSNSNPNSVPFSIPPISGVCGPQRSLRLKMTNECHPYVVTVLSKEMLGRREAVLRKGTFRESSLKGETQLFTFCPLPFLSSLPGERCYIGSYRKGSWMTATNERTWREMSQEAWASYDIRTCHINCEVVLWGFLLHDEGKKTNLLKPLYMFLLHVAKPILPRKIMLSTLK